MLFFPNFVCILLLLVELIGSPGYIYWFITIFESWILARSHRGNFVKGYPDVETKLALKVLPSLGKSTIKGASRRAEKSRKVLMMMMKAAKLQAGAGLKHVQGRSRAEQN